jgi:hypothetical protein
MAKSYEVNRAGGEIVPAGEWDGEIWKDVELITIDNPLGEAPVFVPKAQAKLVYDDRFVYVIFRVEDRFVRAVAKRHQEPVHTDSCVEFFFTPGEDIRQGYFNIEVNCGGTVVSRHQTAPMEDRNPLTDAEIESLDIYHSQPRIVEPEKKKPTEWLIEYHIPVGMLGRFCPVIRPAAGVVWRANFYKCGQETSNPHLLTWSAIESEKINFHQPEFFGKLEFV